MLYAESQVRISCMMSGAAALDTGHGAVLAHQKCQQCMWRYNWSQRGD